MISSTDIPRFVNNRTKLASCNTETRQIQTKIDSAKDTATMNAGRSTDQVCPFNLTDDRTSSPMTKPMWTEKRTSMKPSRYVNDHKNMCDHV